MSKAILLADDSVTIQKVIELTFMDQDIQIQAVSSGDEALRQLEGGAPDLVIADVHMPGASGFDVARRSKEISPQTPVLLLVGTFEPFDEADFRACGADEVLKKPFDSQELLRLVETLLPSPGEATEDAPDTGAGDGEADDQNAAPPAPRLDAPDLEDTGVFTLDDDAFDGSSSEVLPPADMAGTADAPVAGLAWEDPVDEEDLVDEEDSVDEEDPQAEALEDEAAELTDDFGADFSGSVAAEDESEEDISAEDESADDETEEDQATGSEAGDDELTYDELTYGEAGDDEAGDEVQDDDDSAVAAAGGSAAGLSDEDIERIAVRVAQLVGEKVSRDIAWEVIPDLAEVIINQRLRELESQVE